MNHFIAIYIQIFGCHNKNTSQKEECHTPMSSLFHNFQSIGILTLKCFIFDIFLDE